MAALWNTVSIPGSFLEQERDVLFPDTGQGAFGRWEAGLGNIRRGLCIRGQQHACGHQGWLSAHSQCAGSPAGRLGFCVESGLLPAAAVWRPAWWARRLTGGHWYQGSSLRVALTCRFCMGSHMWLPPCRRCQVPLSTFKSDHL